jgi:phosphoglycolate phosphatase
MIDMKNLAGIVFDKDGTLFDFEATWTPWAASLFMRLCNQNRDEATKIAAAVGFDLSNLKFAPDSVVIAGTPEDIVTQIVTLIPEMSRTEIIGIVNDEAENAPMVETTPLVPFLGGLKARGLKLGVATNDAESPALAHLTAVGVHELFDFIAGSDSGFGGKPAPGQLLGFCDAVGVDPRNVAMVGDSLHDLHAGKAAGFFRIGVLTGLATRRDLADHADVVLENITQIPALLDGKLS